MTEAKSLFDVSTAARRFRAVAVAEAITWLLLLIGMAVKYGAGVESATMVVGMLHGVVFVLYVLVTLVSARALKWDWTVALLALFASIPPFFTVLFEWWAKREGYLAELSADAGELRAEDAEDAEAGGEPDDLLIWTILVTVLCFPPLGIAGIVKSAAVGRRWAEGDYAGARRAAAQARNLVLLTAMVGFVVIFMIAMVATVGPPGGS